MSNNSINYALFFILLAAVALDVYLSANVALQMVCILLAVGLLAVVAWIAFKLHLGTYVSNEQADNLQSYLSANIKLTNELKECERQLSRAQQSSLALKLKRVSQQKCRVPLHKILLLCLISDQTDQFLRLPLTSG